MVEQVHFRYLLFTHVPDGSPDGKVVAVIGCFPEVQPYIMALGKRTGDKSMENELDTVGLLDSARRHK